VWAVNSAGRTGSPWVQGHTGPAPPEGMSPLKFLHVHATSAVVDISPPKKPNGIVSLYRVFTQNKDSYQLVHNTQYRYSYTYINNYKCVLIEF